MPSRTVAARESTPTSNDAPWTCPGCRAVVSTRYCPTCGEEPPRPHDLTFAGLVEKLVDALTSIDAHVARTAWCLVRRPGHLTVAWVSGVRKAYVAPFALFLIANLLFFTLQWVTGASVLSSPLASHLHQQDWSGLARETVARRLASTHVPLEAYAPVFDRAVVLYAKTLIVLMTIPFALVVLVVFHRARRPFMAHVVFSVHLYTFLLLVFCVALVVAKASAALGLGGLESPLVDHALSIANVAVCAGYLHRAIEVVYGWRGATALSAAVALTVVVAAIVVGYRFALFVLTLWTT